MVELARIYDILLKSSMLLCVWCLLMSCSADEELQPARLIEARGYVPDIDVEAFQYSGLPLNGRGIIKTSTIIGLVFDKPVFEVSINYSAKAEPDEMSPTTIWKLESNRLEDVWRLRNKNVTLTIIYEDETGIHKDTLDVTLDLQSDSPRVIAVDPIPGTERTKAVELIAVTQEFRITFNEPIRPNSGCILFGSSRIQLQETEPTDTITFNQCFRRLQYGLAPGALVISDFANVKYDIQPHAFKAWYWMPRFDIAPPAALENYPIGVNVDPETTRGIRVEFDRPMAEAYCEITPAITLSPAHIQNETIKGCSGIATWEFVGAAQLDYSTQYDVEIDAVDRGGQHLLYNFSFTTRAAPVSD